MEETEREFFFKLAAEEKLPELRRYFEALADVAVFSDRERYLAQAEEFGNFLLEKRESRIPPEEVPKLVDSHSHFALQDQSSAKQVEVGEDFKAPPQRAILQVELDQAKTLGELGTIALRNLMEQAGVDEKYLIPLKKRLRWVDGVDWTLESAASLIEVTRERLRQVVRRLDGCSIRVLASPRILFRTLHIGASARDLDEFFASLRLKGLAHTDDQWSKQALTELFLMVGNEDVQDELASLFRRLSPIPRSSRLEAVIRSHRLKELGIVPFGALSVEIESSPEDLLEMLSQMYRYVFGDEELAVTVGNPPGGFISAVGKQLLVSPTADPAQLLVGLRKVEAYRHAKVAVGEADFRRALKVTFGDPPKLATIPDELSALVTLTPFEEAVSEKFANSGRNLLHRDELVEAAVHRGVSAVSAGVYLSTSPIIRSSLVRRGYFSLV
jgi:hypothetical protein